jgi:hypothetical protein
MKNKTISTLSAFLLIFGTVFLLSSYKNDIKMYGKAVFPITDNMDEAHAKTELNGHVIGDTTNGFSLWGKDYWGKDFLIQSPQVDNMLSLGNPVNSVGDTLVSIKGRLVTKRIKPSNDIKMNWLSCSGNISGAVVDQNVHFLSYLLDSNFVVIAKLVDTTGTFGNRYYNLWFPLDTVRVLKKSTLYYIGIYEESSINNPVAKVIGQKFWHQVTSFPLTDGTFPYWNLSTPPSVGDTLGSGISPDDWTMTSINVNYLYNAKGYPFLP